MTTANSLEQARFNMIEQQIRPWEVLDGRVLELLGRVRREDFAPAAHRALAFTDMELPLTQPAVDGQCMLAPRVQARLVQDLALKPTDKVLEIGTGSGYTAALMASLAQRVLSLEIEPALASQARTRLMQAGVTNVEVRQADAAANGFAACRADGPYDAILLGGSLAEVPPALLGLLAPGGRLAAIVGDEPVMRATFITRAGEADYRSAQPWDTLAPRLRHFPEPSRFRF
ncbi:MAG: protein-L-isoaspartate O-methyltransferase [Comamonadaceae bacterium]|jgi:protein-L-isoaspartate(D-aspartate) O-methyltransferase|uniref:Protein-L-isoaspartate O-methyltransferase n=1 Tax=Hydrogenophaga borbori TaxID=2294117 RepID=A0A372EL10_9BURK|nr:MULTISPECIES: protein-L-isoaspartate O-methyltransferase [Hydrogenophaga]MBN9370431.1 protein-L-isoaspartate O-methyltransferase [Hydrogenophaga sp.]NCT96509.1 protein-L-isoaspartate O-methyltransferase [Comamonadaceae bacterium]OJV61619.1 MAG: protein-L-isoaspartate O-methyltransferase [Hydrogenophaga sp. 70-12]RFP80068.1 protein-L-isoaspartate O-methyltransferase [Hydrogenophaga borbori]